MPADVGDFKLYDRKVVDAVLSLGEHDRLPAGAGHVGGLYADDRRIRSPRTRGG